MGVEPRSHIGAKRLDRKTVKAFLRTLAGESPVKPMGLRKLLRLSVGRPSEREAPSDATLQEAILELLGTPGDLPTAYGGPTARGVRRVRRVTSDAFEVEFKDRIDRSLLRQAVRGKYTIKEEDSVGGTVWRFPIRVVLNGEIVAHLDRSRRRITLLLYPPSWQWTTYRRVLADLRGIKGFAEAYSANMEAIGLLETYRTLRYGRLR